MARAKSVFESLLPVIFFVLFVAPKSNLGQTEENEEEEDQGCDFSRVCVGSEHGNSTGCLVGRFAICKGKCLSPQFPVRVNLGRFYDKSKVGHLAPLDEFEEICVSGKLK